MVLMEWPSSCALFGGFAIGARVLLLWHIVLNTKCQRVLVGLLALWLVNINWKFFSFTLIYIIQFMMAVVVICASLFCDITVLMICYCPMGTYTLQFEDLYKVTPLDLRRLQKSLWGSSDLGYIGDAHQVELIMASALSSLYCLLTLKVR